MDKRGLLFATLTVLIMIGFVIGFSIRKNTLLEKTNLINIGEGAGEVLNLTVKEAQIKFFIEEAMKYSTYRALASLGENGGHYTIKAECKPVQGYVLWKDDCLFTTKIEEEFFSYFKAYFEDYLNKYGLNGINANWDFDDRNKLFLETNGLVDLSSGNIIYGFEPKIKYYVNYNFDDYTNALKYTMDCVEDERLKGYLRNNLYSTCRNNKDFEWEIKTDEKYVLFDITSIKDFENLGKITIKFSLPI